MRKPSIFELASCVFGLVLALAFVLMVGGGLRLHYLLIFVMLLLVSGFFFRSHLPAILPGSDFFRSKKIKTLSFILLAAAIFRAGEFTHYSGGQDQGLYVGMAGVMARSGQLFYEDNYRRSLSPELRTIYDAYSPPSIALIDSEKSLYAIEFYPLLPVGMAIFTQLFGTGFHGLFLILVSLLSVLMIYKVGAALLNERVGVLAALFLALNPGHIFFSSFPVTENFALFLTLTAIYFLLKALQEIQSRLVYFYGFSSFLFFNLYLYSRMSFFILIAFAGFLILLTYLRPLSSRQNAFLRILGVSLLIAVAINLFYYWHVQSTLFWEMFQPTGQIIAALRRSKWFLIFGTIAILVFLPVYHLSSPSSRLHNSFFKVGDWLSQKTPYLTWGLILVALPSIYQLVKTGNLSPFPWSVYASLESVRYHLIYRYFLFVGPILAILFLSIPRLKFDWPPRVRSLIGFLFIIWVLILNFATVTPYLYYYGRYLSSELVPYTLLLMAVVIWYLEVQKRVKLARFAIYGTTIYFVFFGLPLIGFKESENPKFYYDLSEKIGANDVMIASNSDLNRRFYDPIRYYFDIPIFVVQETEATGPEYVQSIADRLHETVPASGKIYYLTRIKKPPLEGWNLEQQWKSTYRYVNNGEHIFRDILVQDRKDYTVFLLPHRQSSVNYQLYLYSKNRQ